MLEIVSWANVPSVHLPFGALLVVGYTGNFWQGSVNNTTTNGNYWTSSSYQADAAHNLEFNASELNPQNGNNKQNGLTVRCVAQ